VPHEKRHGSLHGQAPQRIPALRVGLESQVARDCCLKPLLLLRIAAFATGHEHVESRAGEAVDQVHVLLEGEYGAHQLLGTSGLGHGLGGSSRVSFPISRSPQRRVRGWLWYMDGVLLDWIDHRDMDRDELRDLLLGTLGGALAAASN
jgi:hypothetical protein